MFDDTKVGTVHTDAPEAREAATAAATRGEGIEAFDTLGYASLFLGVLSLLIMPAMPSRYMSWPVAFSIASIVLGAIRLGDGRRPTRSDAAIAGVVCALVSMVVLGYGVMSDAIRGAGNYGPAPVASQYVGTGCDDGGGIRWDIYDQEWKPRQVPVDDEDDWQPKQVPLADPQDGGSSHRA